MVHTKFFTFNPFQERCTVAWDDSLEGVVVDPGCMSSSEKDALKRFISDNGLKIRYIMLTHAHFDHIFGLEEIALWLGVPVKMCERDIVIIKEANPLLCKEFGLECPNISERTKFEFVREGDTIKAGELEFEVIETPGHTPGGLCFLERKEKLLLSGDTLFQGSIGRTDNKWADYDLMIEGIFRKLMILEPDIQVIPGHGPTTDIAYERMTNPFLIPFNEAYEE